MVKRKRRWLGLPFYVAVMAVIVRVGLSLLPDFGEYNDYVGGASLVRPASKGFDWRTGGACSEPNPDFEKWWAKANEAGCARALD